MEKITLHRALTELKTIDKRIEKAILSSLFIGIKKDDKINGLHETEEFSKSCKSSIQSIEDLIKRKIDLKEKLMKANSSIDVKIGDKTMKIVDAINYKELISSKKMFLAEMKKSYEMVISGTERHNKQVETNALGLAEKALGKENVKIGSDDVEAVMGPYIKKNKVEIFDPLKLKDLIQKMEKEIDEFEINVDACLSEANALNTIEL